METSINAMGEILADLGDEIRFFWDFFDFPDADAGDYTGDGSYYEGEGNDGCVTLDEFATGIASMDEVS